MSWLLVLATFWGLVLATAARPGARRAWGHRSAGDWLVDGSGLLVQGVGVPVVQTTVVLAGLRLLAPEAERSVELPPALGFLLNFVAVDYLYYWNHRLLHTRVLWPMHEVHHSAPVMDVLVTSRNTLWTPLLIVYLWVNAVGAFVLADPRPFLLSAAVTAALDLWRHSPLAPAPGSWAHRLLAAVLITPHEHAWHHSREAHGVNYGANLRVWDVLHGTYSSPPAPASPLGVEQEVPLLRRWLLPQRERTP